jgi:hypothetical protein
MDTTDKVQLAFDRLFGVKEAMAAGIAGFRSIKEAYIFVTGDEDLAFGANGRGGFLSVREAASLTSDFTNLLGVSMNKRLLQDYARSASADSSRSSHDGRQRLQDAGPRALRLPRRPGDRGGRRAVHRVRQAHGREGAVRAHQARQHLHHLA